MAKLGSLWFDIGLNDRTEKDWERIIKNVEKKGAKLGITIDEKNLHSQISQALQNRKYTIDLSLAIKDNQLEAAIQRAYSRVSGAAGSMAGSIRPPREDQLIRAGAYASSQQALERSRNALAELREARLRDAEAARQQKAANDLLGKSLDSNQRLISGLRNEFMNFYSIYTLQNFLGSLISIGGEFQKQHIALQAMLGDAAKADEIFSKIKGLAVESPFNFKDLTGYTKQLVAFSIPYEELYDTTKRLADISAGLGIDMSRIILAYGQVRSAEFLRGQEVRQFTEAGIPLLDELAKKFTELEGRVVSVGEVFDKISNREVPFQMVKDVLWDLTNEGGKFFNMQEVLTESLSGKLDKLKDSYQIMLSEIAKSNNSLLGGSLDTLTNLMDKWESFFTVLSSIIVAYGSYKAVMFAANAVKSVAIVREIGFTNALNLNTLATYANAKAHDKLTMISLRSLASLAKFKTTLAGIGKIGWIGIVLSGIAAIGSYLYTSYENANKLSRELGKISEESRQSAMSDASGFKTLVEQLGKAVKGSSEYNDILSKIQSKYGEYIGNIRNEADAYSYLKNNIDSVTEALKNKNMEQARQRGMSAISEEFLEKKSESSKKAVDRASELLGLSKESAKQLIGIISNDISNGMATALTQGYDKAVEYISNKAKEAGIEIKIKIGDGNNIFGVETLGGAASLVDYLRDLYTYTAQEEKAVKDLNDTLNTTFGNFTPYGIEIEKLQKSFDLEKKSIPTEAISKQRQAYLQLLEAKKAVYEKYGQEGEAKKIEAEIAEVSKLKDEWRELATEKLKAYIGLQPTNDEKELEYVDKLKKRYKELQEIISTVGVMNPELVEKSKAEQSAIKEVLDAFKISTDTQKTSGADTVLKQWQERIKLIEKAISTYKEWAALEGKDKAYQRVQSNQTFSPVLSYIGTAEDISDPSKIWERVLKEIPKDKKELVMDIGFKVEKSNQDKLKSDIDKSLKDVEEHIKKTTEQWNLYKNLLQSGVSGDVAMRLSFGGENPFANIAEQFKADIAKALKENKTTISIEQLLGMDENNMNLTFGAELGGELAKLVQQYKDAGDEIYRNTLASAAKLIAQNRSYEDQIIEIKRKANEDIKNLEAQRAKFGDETTDKAIAQRRVNEQKEIGDVRFEQFKNTDDWEKAFGDLDKLTTSTINRMIASFIAFREAQRQNLSVDDIKKLSDIIEKMQREVTARNPFERIALGFKNLKAARKSGGDTKSAWAEISDGLKGVEGQINDCVGAAGDLQDMFDSIGDDSLADMMGLLQGVGSGISNLVGAASSFASGNVLGGVTGAVSGITGIISSIADFHDKKLDKAIERSELKVKQLENAYKNLESTIERQLGAISQQQSDEMVANLEKQRAEIVKQMQAESDKKDSDPMKIEDYKQQIAELDEQIQYFYEDLMSEQFGIDLKDWAAQISDAITEAFSKGEDAAKAFDETVANIMRNVVNEMFKMVAIEPMMEQLRTMLFGDSAKLASTESEITALEEELRNSSRRNPELVKRLNYLKEQSRKYQGLLTDGELSDSDISQIASSFEDMKEKIPQWEELWDRINEATGGILDQTEEASEGLSGGIQGITEDTADLLASYINAMRADVSLERGYIEKIANEMFPKMSVIAQAQLTQLEIIARNTEATASNTSRNVDLVSEIRDIINGARVNKEKGFYIK